MGLLSKLFGNKTTPETEQPAAPKIKIWEVLSGITYPEELLGENPYENGEVFLKLKISLGDQVEDYWVAFNDAASAQALINHFNTNFDPVEIQ